MPAASGPRARPLCFPPEGLPGSVALAQPLQRTKLSAEDGTPPTLNSPGMEVSSNFPISWPEECEVNSPLLLRVQ